MAKVKNILGRNEKKLDLTRFFPDEEEETYIYIRKLTPIDKKKVKYFSMETISKPENKEIFKSFMSNSDILTDKDKMDNLNDSEKLKLAEDLEIEKNFNVSMIDMVDKMEVIVMDAGIHPDKHNFLGDDDKPVELSYEILSQMCDQDCLDYIYKEINLLSGGVSLGK